MTGTVHRATVEAAALAGAVTGPLTQAVDARWLMAYSAGVAARHRGALDTLAPGNPVAHPLFPVCYEWPLMVALRDRAIGVEVSRFGVHASHRLLVHRAPRAGDMLTTTARVTAVRRKRAGMLVVVRLVTVDAAGAPVTTTDYGSVYRGVVADAEVEGEPPLAWPDPPPAGEVRWTEAIAVAPQAAHVYTECARIWNPIHTDPAVAREAGLSAPILHGTATLALAVSRVVDRELGGDAAPVRGVSARFVGMVPVPSSIAVRGRGHAAGGVAFEVVASDGTPVLTEGVLLA